MNTATRALLGFLLVVTAAFYFFIDQLSARVERQYLEAAEEPMVDTAHVLAAYLEEELEGEDFSYEKLRRVFAGVQRRHFEARIYSLVKTSVAMNVYVTDRNGIVLFDSRDGQAEGENYGEFHDVSRTLRGEYGARSTRTNDADEFSSIMYVGAPVRKNGETVAVLSVSKPQASMFEFMADTHEYILLWGWTILAGAGLATVLLSHWFFAPIRKLTQYTHAVRRAERVSLPRLSGADMKTLGRALEEMLDALEDRKYVESYVQTLTHEMKSPVAAIRGAAELLQEESMPAAQRQKFLANIQTETERLQKTIDRLLALSAIEGMKVLQNAEEISVTDLVDEICESQAQLLETRRVQLRRIYSDQPKICGEAFLLEIAVRNLLENAIDFSPAGGTVTVRVGAEGALGRVEIAVEDEGPGVPDYALERVFDRFYSLRHPATGRKSSGLGLCFVKEAASLHGGSATLENRRDRSGARAVLTVKG